MIPWLVVLQATMTIATAGPLSAPEYWPLWVAQSEGYFAEEGLDVTITPFRAEGPAAEALGRGQAELAATSLDAAITLGHSGGVPPRIVFGLTAAPPVALLVPRGRQEAIQGLADLVGKTIGVTAPGTAAQLALISLLGAGGIRPHQVKTKSFGERGLAAALVSGEVAAGMVGDPDATRLVESGEATVLVDLRRPSEAARWLKAPTVNAAVFIRADTALGPDKVKPLVRALLKAVARLRTAPAEELRAKLPASAIGFPEDFEARLHGAREIYLQDGMVTTEVLGDSLALVRDRSAIPSKVSVPRSMDKLLFTEPLDEVLAAR